ncbi:MAG: DUF5329 family protein [Planctomycetota bacterium]
MRNARYPCAGVLVLLAVAAGCQQRPDPPAPAPSPAGGAPPPPQSSPNTPTVATGVAPQPMSETEKIERMLAKLGESDAVFIRNASEYDGKAAAAHLRSKWSNAGSRVKTASDFINALASSSSTSGKAYQIRKKDGSTVPSREWFEALLAEIETAK